MKYSQAYKYGQKRLKASGIENAEFDNRIIFEHSFGLDRVQLAIKGEQQAPEDKEERFLKDIDARIKGKPLQYIIGNWEFMGHDFFVGEGVLIPREETELLVEVVQNELKKSQGDKIIFDLCSGSGCIGLSVARFCENCKVYLIEKSQEALYYLNKNVSNSKLHNVTVIQGDIAKGFDYFSLPYPDIIVSNPPYIKSADIENLQSEVKHEPEIALDGGYDGLDFYKILAEKWMPSISRNGMIAVEIGDGQDKDVCKVFSKKSENITKKQDFSGIIRVITARK